MELMILKTVNDNIKEAFVKLEDNNTVTVGFVGKKGRYLFVEDDLYEFDSRPIIRFKKSTLPKNCGIFLIEDDKAYTACYSGDLGQIKSKLNQAKGYTVLDRKENKEVPDPKATSTKESASVKKNTPMTEDLTAESDTFFTKNTLDNDACTSEENAIKNALVTNTYTAEEASSVAEKEVEPDASLEFEPDEEDNKEESEYKSNVLPEDFLAPQKKAPESFWDCNEDKFNGLFSNYPENENLTGLIPGSKWVDIEDEGYVFGVIYDENNSPMYICYGFPLPWDEEPPERLEGYCQWIPVNCTRPHDDGYWVIYINAKTGERIK